MSNRSDPLAATNVWSSSGKEHQGSEEEAPSGRPVTPPDIPERLGRYRVEGLLGGGGFGWVYRAFDEQLGRAVAIKVPDERLLKNALNSDAYRNEARLVAQLDHPHILPVYDVGSAPGVSCYVVSRLITGRDLAHQLREERMSYLESADIIAKLARALHHAHKQGIIHRDIKPGNVLLDQKRTPYLADFGLALDESTFGKGPEIAGTPAYMSPEQASGEGHRVDGRADVFSLGVVFYELLTGRRPFTAANQRELLEQIINHDPRPPRQIDDHISREFERVCLKAMAKRILDRYTTAKDMAEDLEAAIVDCTASSGMNSTIAISMNSSPHAVTSGATAAHASTPAASATRTPQTPTATGRPLADAPKSNPARVIPKGLRSFDEKDADYFLDLLPGARDRDGLPGAVRFWKTHVESREAVETFPVGLLYGPSGCGKSSLVKAGLIPRLNHDCTPIYFEATPETTEVRLLQALRRACPGLPESDLVDTFARIRRGEGKPSGRKIIIFIDQFEQWLHAHRAEEDTLLARALRHCDGVELQCVLMVRDDFWMSVTRFMRDLEVRLVEGWNSAAVDLFGPRHARRVLAAFGRAYGCVPADCDEEGPAPHAEFIRQAVAGLTENGTVIPVRLALLADMMKLREWNASSLQAIGGAAGIGAAFLEETFAAPTAPPEHRYHQQAARNVLKSLLYVPGQATSIKGGMRSTEELLRASGYQRRPEDFEHLIRILDGELRLITPTEPEPSASHVDSTSATSTDVSRTQYYQLTHDYLVPTLRDWLTRKQRETMRGRAELRLEERCELWNARPVSSQLPAWWEVLDILMFTRRQQWTPEHRRMMSAALGKQSIHVALLVAMIAVLGWGALEANGRIRAGALADRVARSETKVLPQILDELTPYRRWAVPLLRAERTQATPNSTKWVNTTLALLPTNPDLAKPLADYAVGAPKDEFSVIRESLVVHRRLVVDKLWNLLESPTESTPRRIAAGLLLARLVPSVGKGSSELGQARWAQSAGFLVSQLLNTAVNDTQEFEWLSHGFAAAGSEFVPTLRSIYKDRDRDQLQRSIAMNLVESYAANDDTMLLDVLLTSADPARFARLLPQLSAHRETIIPELHAELTSDSADRLSPQWNDVPLDPTWPALSAGTIQQIEAAQGLVAERFAFCQTLPFTNYSEVEANLRTSGYRPLHLRPFAAADKVLVACLWTRDAIPWRSAIDLTPEQVLQTQTNWQTEGFIAYDLAGYLDGTIRYALLAAQDPATEAAELYVGLTDRETVDGWERLRKAPFMFHSLQVAIDENNFPRHSWVTQKRGRSTFRYYRSLITDNIYHTILQASGLPLFDVSIQQPVVPQPPDVRYRQVIAACDERLRIAADDLTVLAARADAHFCLQNNEQALADYTALLAKSPGEPTLLALRSAVLSRLNRIEEARNEAQRLRKTRGAAKQFWDFYREAFFAPGLGEYSILVDATPKLVLEGQQQPGNMMEYNLACVHSIAARELARKNPDDAAAAIRRAMEHLKTSEQLGELSIATVLADRDLDALHGDREFQDLVKRKIGDWWYVAAWIGTPGRESRGLDGIDPAAHLEQSRKLIVENFRPVSLSVASKDSGNTLGVASAWQRPSTTAAEFNERAARRAYAAITSMQLGEESFCWDHLRQSPDPSERSLLIHSFAALNVRAETLVKHLDNESDDSVRQALLLSLGEYSINALPAAERESLKPRLLDLYQHDSDPGVHAAVEWLMRQWNFEKDRRFAELEILKSTAPAAARRWSLNSQGQTLVSIPANSFNMGSPEYEENKSYDEVGHERTIASGYEICTKPVTFEQFAALLKAHPELRRPEHDEGLKKPDHPVTMVTWFEAAQYCRWLSEVEGISEDQMCYPPISEIKPGMVPIPGFLRRTGYRLPTEAEWEYACRAGSTTPYYFGYSTALLDKYGWYRDDTDKLVMPVAQLKPNAWGLFDMHGNVMQWCYDQYTSEYIDRQNAKVSEVDDTKAVQQEQRVDRGGTVIQDASKLRAASRDAKQPSTRNELLGFRLARTSTTNTTVAATE